MTAQEKPKRPDEGSTVGKEGWSTAVRCWVLALQHVMREESLSKGDVAKTVGRAQQYIGRLLADPDAANPGVRLMEAVALKVGGVDLDKFLAFGEELDSGNKVSIKEYRRVDVPTVVGLAKDGTLETTTRHSRGVVKISESEYAANGWDKDGIVVYYMAGDDMAPLFCAGTRLLVNIKDKEPKDGSFYLVRFFGALALRRIRFENGRLILHAENPTVGPVDTTVAGIGSEGLLEIFGRVVDAQMRL